LVTPSWDIYRDNTQHCRSPMGEKKRLPCAPLLPSPPHTRGSFHLTTSIGHGLLTTSPSPPDNFPPGNLHEKKDNFGRTGPPDNFRGGMGLTAIFRVSYNPNYDLVLGGQVLFPKKFALLPATGLDGAPGSASASARWPPPEPWPAPIKTKLRQACGEMQCLKRWKLKFSIVEKKTQMHSI